MKDEIFEDFLGKFVKVPYIDGKNIKIARGMLDAVGNGFVKIKGDLGVIIINMSNIQKITFMDNMSQEMRNGTKCGKKQVKEILA